MGSKFCDISHHLPWWCMATWRNRIIELEIGGGERNVCVCVCVYVCERGKKNLK
jgi:hypothetical protein